MNLDRKPKGSVSQTTSNVLNGNGEGVLGLHNHATVSFLLRSQPILEPSQVAKQIIKARLMARSHKYHVAQGRGEGNHETMDTRAIAVHMITSNAAAEYTFLLPQHNDSEDDDEENTKIHTIRRHQQP